MHFQVNPSKIYDASVTVPGDKSISHRALMLGSIATGQTAIKGFLAGKDCLATMSAMQLLGVEIDMPSSTEILIQGCGLNSLQKPGSDLNLENSGTAMRLLAGLLSGQRFSSVLRGDESLSGRPMGRIIAPLTLMGAVIGSDPDGTPPLHISGGMELNAIHYDLPMASAQVKSALLLAGLYADGVTSITEPAVTRDHTERMLGTMGVTVVNSEGKISLEGGQQLDGCNVNVPADLSSASFVILAVLLAEKADVMITNVGVNPTRTGVIEILQGMGGDITLENKQLSGGEPIADIRVRSSQLSGCNIDPALVSLAIDEFPVLFVAAAAASGETIFSGIAELRVKESDRISAMSEGLRNLGIRIDEQPDGAIIQGGQFTSGTLQSYGDHRIAMSLAIAGTVASDSVTVKDVAAVDTSFPDFCQCMAKIGADINLIKST
ncbi:MAG: 3-phosphoshikimate 1-carboxyvinyltransferase [Woeseiaceae bacterium]|nr:3-phosphoshikimate 1-carboxyvinyltransferase [Woeseiaceae bacterium]